jgi:predicted DNA-binding transcriptional regulator AlpA
MQSIQESFQNMARAVEQELESIRERAKVHERQLRDALDEVRLLRRKEAAELLGMSNSALDRMVASGELKAVYLDSCPRFQLIELKRVIEVSRTSQTRRRKSCGRS